MRLESPMFEPNGWIPEVYTRNGDDLSPPLRWSNLPEDAEALALVVEDPDAPGGTLTHWLAWDIPITQDHLNEGISHTGWLADDTHQGDNDFDERGWSGPKPPTGETHRYVFHLYALDHPLRLQDGANKRELLSAMAGHVVDETTLIGHYGA